MQVFPGQACRGVARQSEDWSAREKLLSARVCVRLRLILFEIHLLHGFFFHDYLTNFGLLVLITDRLHA